MTITGKPITNLPEVESVTNEDLLLVYKDGVAKRAAASMFRGDPGQDATINGENVLTIEAGENVTIAKDNGVMTISSDGAITGATVNGTAAPVSHKMLALTVPTQVSELTNDRGYATTTEMSSALGNKVDKVTGKGLSTNDYTNADKNAVATIGNKVDKVTGKGLSTNDYTDADKAAVATIGNKVDKVSGKGLSTNDYTDADKAAVAAIGNKVDKVTGKGLSTNDYTTAEKNAVATIGNKVDKVTGKGLSTNDYTTAEKDKLLGIEAGAQVNEVTSEHYRSMMAMLNIVRLQDAGFQKQFEQFRTVFDNFLYAQGIPCYMTAVGTGRIRIEDAAAGQIHSITVDRSLSGQKLYVQLSNSSGMTDTNVTVNSDGVALVSIATKKGGNILYITTSAYTFPPVSGGGHSAHTGGTFVNSHKDENGQFAYDYWIPQNAVEAKVRYVQDSELGDKIARAITYDDFLAMLGLSVTYSVTSNPAAVQSAGKQLYMKMEGYPFGTQEKPTYAKTSYPNTLCGVYYVAEYHQLMV